MNVFVLDREPIIAAQMNCDKHVVKIPTEVTQVLSVAVLLLGGSAPYKMTHVNHPLIHWAKRSVNHRIRLRDYGIALCGEYKFRYIREHACMRYLTGMNLLLNQGLELNDEFPMCIPEKYKNPADIYKSYRDMYIGEKSHLLTYTKRLPPSWIPNDLCVYKEMSKRERELLGAKV